MRRVPQGRGGGGAAPPLPRRDSCANGRRQGGREREGKKRGREGGGGEACEHHLSMALIRRSRGLQKEKMPRVFSPVGSCEGERGEGRCYWRLGGRQTKEMPNVKSSLVTGEQEMGGRPMALSERV